MSPSRSCDVLVVGMGAAGCFSAIRLAAAGAEVLMVGGEATATALSTGRIDLTGVQNAERVSSLLKEVGADFGLYQGPVHGCRAVTNHGTLMRQTLCSEHDWVLRDLKDPVAVMSFEGNVDLEPLVVCSAMAGEGTMPRCRPYRSGLTLPLSVPTKPGRPLTDEVKASIDQIAPVISELEEPTVVLPPIFSGPGSSLALSALEMASNQRVREAATPLSNPGQRLQQCLEAGTSEAGCTVWKGRSVRSIQVEKGVAIGVMVRSGLRELAVKPKAILLATGNLVAGGLQAEGREVIDPLDVFATEGAEAIGIRSPGLGRALATGIRNKEGRAILKSGTVARNVFVTGSARPGLSYPLGKGLGHVLADAMEQAALVEEAL